MGKLSGLCVLLIAALSGALAAGDSVTQVNFTDGHSLTLNVTPSQTEPITNILWKFNGNLLAEWVLNQVPLELFGTFKERATLDTRNARLVVNSMTKADTGAYTVEINSKVHAESYDARWFRRLGTPEVVIRPLTCSAGSKTCNASCEADTDEAEPVTYSWKMGDNPWMVSKKVTEINQVKNVNDECITCRISNPVGVQVSAPIKNPFYVHPTPWWIIIIVVVLVVVVLVLVLVFLWKRKKNGDANKIVSTTPPPRESPSGPPSEEHPLKERDDNGAPATC
ncbi:uncharacterized protein LOC117744467 [Cyclopterus lumpus]|uniref:uncharacterized protein LOC117744467 n=1 Tax=Cyclopterus lumpus TaxID=8103 RepID=UPI001487129C|nr:uncharacterized protein LOC117744467 [Cyclopterus lumpus]